MFGFLKLKACRISSEDKALYGSHFCSVCHAMTRFGGRVSSLLTNYDITFWFMLQSALDSKPVLVAEKKPCTVAPFRAVSVKPIDNQVSQTLAALNLVLVGSKIEDDEQDGERWKAKGRVAWWVHRASPSSEFEVQADPPLRQPVSPRIFRCL